MERTLTVYIKTDINQDTFDVSVIDGESGTSTTFTDVPFSPDEHPEFNDQIGSEIYSWIIYGFECDEDEKECESNE